MARSDAHSLDRFSNETLVTMALKGTEQALHLLLERNLDRIFTLMYAANGNRAESEELTTEAAYEIVAKMRDFKGETSYEAWQYGLVRKIIAKNLKGRYRHPKLISTLWFETLLTEEDLIEASDSPVLKNRAHDLATSILEQLPEDHSKLLRLRLLEREPLENAAAHLRITDDDILREQYLAVRDAAALGAGVRAEVDDPKGSGDETEAENDDELLDKAEILHRYIQALITESPASNVGHQFAEEEISLLRTAHIFVFAGISDFDLRMGPAESENVFNEGWKKLRLQNARVRAETPVLWGLTRKQLYLSGGTSILAIAVIAASFLMSKEADTRQKEALAYHGKIVKERASAFGKLAVPSVNESASESSGLIGETVSIRYVWSGEETPAFPAAVPVQRQTLKKIGLNRATSFAGRFGFTGEPLAVTDGPTYIFGEGTLEDPDPGTYRLEINASTRRYSYLLIGSASEPPVAANSPESDAQLPGDKSLAATASTFLATKGLLAPFFAKPIVERTDTPGLPLSATVAFSRQIDGNPLVVDGGESTGGETTVVIDADGDVTRADGAVPSDWESSLYPLMSPLAALKKEGERQESAATVITVGLTSVKLVYRELNIDSGATLIAPYYLFSGRVAAVDEEGGGDSGASESTAPDSDASGEKMILMVPALDQN